MVPILSLIKIGKIFLFPFSTYANIFRSSATVHFSFVINNPSITEIEFFEYVKMHK